MTSRTRERWRLRLTLAAAMRTMAVLIDGQARELAAGIIAVAG